MSRLITALMLSGAIAVITACDTGGDSAKTATAAPTSFTSTDCGTYSGRGCARPSERVDLKRPVFSKPTEITNPFFPISDLHSAVLLGHVDGKPFRTETTLLPGIRTVRWDGEEIEVRVSQYMAFLDGRLAEVAIDRYAQADDGSVWYLGEDVFDYEEGSVAVTEGTWLAGKEGPPAMIMPGNPEVGNVFRPENIPGVVFEEVRIKSVSPDSVVADELHLDGAHSDKVFRRGYGEYRTVDGSDLEALALAVPTDSLSAPAPTDLESLATGAAGILESARLEDSEAVVATNRQLRSAWTALEATSPPRLVRERLGRDLNALTAAVRARRSPRIEQEAIDVWRSALDLELLQRPPADIDRERINVWTQQLRVAAAAKDAAGVAGSVAVLEWMQDRLPQSPELDARLRALRIASDARNLPAAADHAARLGARFR